MISSKTLFLERYGLNANYKITNETFKRKKFTLKLFSVVDLCYIEPKTMKLASKDHHLLVPSQMSSVKLN